MTASPRRPEVISVFLLDGTPQGLRSVEIGGWTGVCLDFPRSDFAQARTRPELARGGVYVLSGPSESDFLDAQVYIGETEGLVGRLDEHQRAKDFWTRCTVLAAKDDLLSKAHIRYLEARFINLARSAKRVQMLNGTTPVPGGLSEREVAITEAYLEKSLLVLPIVGLDHFGISPSGSPAPKSDTGATPRVAVETAPAVVPASPTRDEPFSAGDIGVQFYLREGRSVTDASGMFDASGRFVVLAGSVGPAHTQKMTTSYLSLRTHLRESGVLTARPPGSLVVTESYAFKSPSAAASVMTGSSRNGQTCWKTAQNRTIAQVMSSQTLAD